MKKLLTLIFILCAPSAFALEDYTTYTEVDPSADLTVSANSIAISTIRNDVSTYVYSNEGTGAIGDFVHEVDTTVSSFSFGIIGVWAVSNTVDDYNDLSFDHNDGLGVRYEENSTNNERICLEDFNWNTVDCTGDIGEGTFYLIIDRDDVTCRARIYSDAAHTSAIDTLSILCANTTYQYQYGMLGYGRNSGDGSTTTGSVDNLELAGTVPTVAVTLLPSFQSVQEDLDYFGGWEGLQTQGTLQSLTGNFADRVTGLCIRDEGAFAGRDFTGLTLQPNYNKFLWTKIKGNNDNIVCIEPNDRIEFQLQTNGDFEVVGTLSWDDIGTPSVSMVTTGTQLPWSTQAYYIEGADTEGITQGTLLIQGDRTGHNTQWSGEHKAIGYIYKKCSSTGTVQLKIEDPNGTIYNNQVGFVCGQWEDFETSVFSSSYEGAVTGTMSFFCNGGDCQFLVDDVEFGEYNYGSVYNTYVGIDDYNSGNQQYAILGKWRVEKIGNRWWIIDPLDNVFFTKCSNNHDTLLIQGRDFDGNDFCTNINAKYSTPNVCSERSVNQTEELKQNGFNCIGSILSSKMYPPNISPSNYTYIPIVLQGRIKNYNFTDIGDIDLVNTTMDDNWPDVMDSDWIDKFTSGSIYTPPGAEGVLSLSAGEEFRQVNDANIGQYDVTFYKDDDLGAGLFPFYMGYDYDEEPRGSGGNYSTLGYLFFISIPSHVTDGDGVNDTLSMAVNSLRVTHSAGGEDTFINNITFGGSNEITSYDNWITVTGTVAGKDAAALSNLNTAWGTTYSSWEAVTYEDGDDDTDLYSSGLDENAGFEAAISAQVSGCSYDVSGSTTNCKWGYGSVSTIQDDIDNIHINYARRMFEPFHTHIFGPTGRFEDRIIHFGPGVFYHKGWGNGIIGADGTKYLKAQYVLGVGGDFGNRWTGTDHSLPVSGASTFEASNIPFVSESNWLDAVVASDMGFSGTVDTVYKLADSSFGVYIGDGGSGDDWDCDAAQYASIATYCSATTDTFRIPEDSTIYWNCTDPTDTGTCDDSGVLHWQFIADVDQPIVNSAYANRATIIADLPLVTGISDNDVITTGTLMFTLSSAQTRVSMVVDEDGNFDTDFNNPNALDQLFGWHVFVDLEDTSPVRYYMIAQGYTTDRSVICWKDWTSLNNSSPTGFTGYPGNFLDVTAGDRYEIDVIFQVDSGDADEHYRVRTQDERAKMYINIYRQIMLDKYIDSQGTNYFMGWHMFSAISDYGFNDTFGGSPSIGGGREIREWGWYTHNGNLKDGIQNTIANGERRNYGNFTGPVKRFLNNIYRTLLTDDIKSDGVTLNGVILR